MQKYAKVENEETKACRVAEGSDTAYYESQGMSLQDVEQAYDGTWYLAGYAPTIPAELAKEERIVFLKSELKRTDYIWNVINEGMGTTEDYAEMINYRKACREEIRELEAE